MNGKRSDRKESSFETLVSFASEPPPPGDGGDVHSARTAVAALPDSFLDDLRRGKLDDPTTSRYRVLPETDVVERDAPTMPPPVSARVRELNAAISAAFTVALPRYEPPPEAYVPSPTVALPRAAVEPEPAAIPAPPLPPSALPTRDEDRWVVIALAVAIIVALLAAGTPDLSIF